MLSSSASSSASHTSVLSKGNTGVIAESYLLYILFSKLGDEKYIHIHPPSPVLTTTIGIRAMSKSSRSGINIHGLQESNHEVALPPPKWLDQFV